MSKRDKNGTDEAATAATSAEGEVLVLKPGAVAGPESPLVHGANLKQKERGGKKYADPEAKKMLAEIRGKYDVWRAAKAPRSI